MRAWIVAASLLLAGPAAAQSYTEAERRAVMDAGQYAGTLIACAAPPRSVFLTWRLAEVAHGLGREAEFSLHYLAGVMVGMQHRIPPAECTDRLRALRERLGK